MQHISQPYEKFLIFLKNEEVAGFVGVDLYIKPQT